MSRAPVVAAVVSLLLASAARAESARLGSFELGVGTYYPNVDAEAGLAARPYEQIFGTSRGWMFRAGIARAILVDPGALEVGLRSGFFRDSGKSLQKDASGTITAGRSTDSTTFNVIPTSLTLTYRLDLFADRHGVPLAPYARFALERYNWWVTKEGGGSSEQGATNGWSWTAGIAVLLDFFDRGLARELDRDTGINHTYAFFDVTDTHVDDFGSSRSWDLSDKRRSLGFGLMFVF